MVAKARRWTNLAVGTSVSFLLAGESVAVTYVVEKRVTWEVTDETTAPDWTELEGPATGMHRHAHHIFGQDIHDKMHEDEPPEGAAPVGPEIDKRLTETLTGGGGRTIRPTRTKHLHWSDLETFNQGSNLPVTTSSDILSGAPPFHPRADASTEQQTQRQPPSGDPPNERFFTLAINKIRGEAKLELPLHDQEFAFVESFATAEIKLTGKVSATTVVNGEAPPKTVRGSNVGAIGSKIDNSTGQGAVDYEDPVVLSVLDAVTSAVIAEEQLWLEEWAVRGEAGIEWTASGGLVLTAEPDATASFSFQTLSTWVTNPFTGTAQIVNGNLTTTGDLTALSWSVQTVGQDIVATLPTTELPIEMSFVVVASGLGTPSNDLLLVLSANNNGLAEELAAIHLPATGAVGRLVLFAVVLALGALLLSRRRAESL